MRFVKRQALLRWVQQTACCVISHTALRREQLWQRPQPRRNTHFSKWGFILSECPQSKPNDVTHFPLFFRVFYLIITAIGKKATCFLPCIKQDVLKCRHRAAAKHTSSGCRQRRGRAASRVPMAGPASPGMFVRKSAAPHRPGFCVPVGNNNISVSIMSYFIKCKGSGTTIMLMQNVKYTKPSLIFHMGKNLPF